LLLALLAPPTGTLLAQGTVSGQINLLERAGETSQDLADAIVWLEPAVGNPGKTSGKSVTIELRNRQFSPRVLAVTEGSKVEFPNMDSFSHNVFSKAPGGAFDTGVYARGRTKDQTFREAGVFPLYCNVHPRMTGYVVVLRTPWFAQAGMDGRFTVANVPTGTYTLHAWHDRAGQETTQTVTVPAAGIVVGRVELDARGFRFVQHKNKFGQEYTNASGDRY
jgi:plastocyanin